MDFLSFHLGTLNFGCVLISVTVLKRNQQLPFLSRFINSEPQAASNELYLKQPFSDYFNLLSKCRNFNFEIDENYIPIKNQT